ncbi:MAG TPA: serine hydrolase domain-containing protein [Flavisolibacter sp.]|nr:serine hydrolase domain-containing protein [Flavisolibacter sp.]
MKNSILSIVLIAALSSCHSPKADVPVLASETAAAAVPALPAAEVKKYHDAVDEVLQKNLLRGSFNGAILVAKEGQIVYEKYVGLKDPRVKGMDSITAETPFQIASTGKTMTAAAILKLWEEGRLNLDDEVTKWFSGFPYPGVTVRTLLNHRSGLPEYLYYMEHGGWNRQQQATNSDVINALIQWKPAKAASADRRFQYCNTNFVLLALIVEKVTGESFPSYMQKTFFKPLGMKNTFVIGKNEQEQHMLSFQANNSLWALDFSDGPYGDKNIYSTPRDLLKWDQAIGAGKVLREQTLDSAYTAYSNEKPGVHNYGLGWRLLFFPDKDNKKVVYHNGHWHGFNTAFSRLPEEATIIILSNRYNRLVYSVAKKLYDVFGDYGNKPHEEDQ